MKYRLSTFLLLITAFCLGLGGFLSGYRTGREDGHYAGWHQATDHHMVMMVYHVHGKYWKDLGEMIAEDGFVNIVSYRTEAEEDRETYRWMNQFDEKWPGIEKWNEEVKTRHKQTLP